MSSTSTGTTRFYYDGSKLAIESDGSGNVLRSYVHGDGADSPVVWYEAVSGGTSRRFLHRDERGSITAIADQSGNEIAVNAYDEYGIPNSGTRGGSATRDRHGYQSLACGITRPGCTRRRSAGSCRPTPSATRMG